MRRFVTGALLVGAIMLVLIGPASAHEEITPNTFPTATPVFFTLSAANEAKSDLVKITLNAAAGVEFGSSTKEPPGWTVTHTDTAITWTGGAVKPDRFEQWGFEVEGADQPGTLSYKVTLGFADGKSTDATVDIKAVAGGAGSTTDSSDDSSSSSGLAVAIGIVALLVAIAALAMALRRGRGTAEPAAVEGAKTQDW